MCDCIKQVNEKMKEYNTQLDLPFFLNGSTPRVQISTEKIESKVRKGPYHLFSEFCPFCGEQYGAALRPSAPQDDEK
jgi:phage terminase large subunit GpA-like protein